MNVFAQTSIWVFVVTVPVGYWLLWRGLRTAQTRGLLRGKTPVPPVKT